MQSRESILRNSITLRQAFFSSVAAIFSLFALLSLLAKRLYADLPKYPEAVVGMTIWRGYPKQADLQVARIVLFGLPLFFLLFVLLTRLWKKYLPGRRNAAIVVFMGYMASLLMILADKKSGAAYLILTVLLAAAYFLHELRKSDKPFGKVVETAFWLSLALSALCIGIGRFLAPVRSFWQTGMQGMYLLFGILTVLCAAFWKRRNEEWIISLTGGVLPLCFLGFSAFTYSYTEGGEEAVIRLFDSRCWKGFCLGLMLILLVLALRALIRQKNGVVRDFPDQLPLLLSLAAMRSFRLPDGVMSIDYFHNGEVTLPMQQLVSFGKLPYRDLVPIHGLCDYYYGLVSELFFDGSYLSLNAAKSVGDLLLALFYALLIWYLVRNLVQRQLQPMLIWVVLPFLTMAGMRYVFAILLLAVMFLGKKDFVLRQLYQWVLLSILAIAWNPSIGGACAIAFLPGLLLLIPQVPGELKAFFAGAVSRKKKLTVLGAWAALGCLGLAFLPLFLSIVSYLRENMGTTLWVNGMEMLSDTKEMRDYFLPSLAGAHNGFFLTAFGWAAGPLVTAVLILRRQKEQLRNFLTFLVLDYVMASYTFVRFDDGYRTGILGGITFLLLAAILYEYAAGRKPGFRARTFSLGFMLLFLLLFDIPALFDNDLNRMEEKIEPTQEIEIMGQKVEDPIVYVSGDSVGMEHLGSGFISANALTNLQNISHVVTSQKGSWLDLTSAPAYEVILDLPLCLPYTSAYNISNELMQDKAISLLSDNLPEGLLLTPEIEFDEAPFSYRCYKLYRYLMQMGYVPYHYENVLYMLRSDVANAVPGAETADREFADAMHKTDQGFLPAIWGGSAGNKSGWGNLESIETGYEISPCEDGVRVVFDSPVDGSVPDMIGFSLVGITEDKELHMVIETLEGVGEAEKYDWKWIPAKDTLLPVGTCPYFRGQKQITALKISAADSETGAVIKEKDFLKGLTLYRMKD